MVTGYKESIVQNGTHGSSTTFYVLSTDTKRTESVLNGSCFIEMDTGKVYFFDAENGEWIEM